MILLWYILIPAVAAPVAWLLGRSRPALARWTAVAGTAVPLVILAGQWIAKASALQATFAAKGPGPAGLVAGSWIADVKATWIGSLGISFFLAADGLTLIMLLLTFALGLLAVLASWRGITERVGVFHLMILWTVAGLAGVFLSLDLFLFYFFFEMMLIPMYFLIAVWGHEKRVYAAIKFFIFTQVSGLLMLVAIVALVFVHGRATGVYTFDFTQLLGTQMAASTAFILMLGFFFAFAVKLPAWPLHTWLPDAHTEAPTAGSVLLAGVLIKIGAYGMLRFMVPLFPDAARDFRTVALILAVIGIIYGAIMAYGQKDMKRLVAYTSVSHMGFVLLGVFAWNTLGAAGRDPAARVSRPLHGRPLHHGRRPAGPHPHPRHGQDGRPLAGGAPDGRHGHVLRHGLARPAGTRQLRRRVPHPGRRLAGEPLGGRARRRRSRVRHRLRPLDDAARVPGRGDARLVVRRHHEARGRHVRRHDRRARAARLLAAAADHHGAPDGDRAAGDDRGEQPRPAAARR